MLFVNAQTHHKAVEVALKQAFQDFPEQAMYGVLPLFSSHSFRVK
jgi:hypothetical protein